MIPADIASGRAGGIAIVIKSSHQMTIVSASSYLMEMSIKAKMPIIAITPMMQTKIIESHWNLNFVGFG